MTTAAVPSDNAAAVELSLDPIPLAPDMDGRSGL